MVSSARLLVQWQCLGVANVTVVISGLNCYHGRLSLTFKGSLRSIGPLVGIRDTCNIQIYPDCNLQLGLLSFS